MQPSVFSLVQKLHDHNEPLAPQLVGARQRAHWFLQKGLSWPTAKSEGYRHAGLETLQTTDWRRPSAQPPSPAALAEAEAALASLPDDAVRLVFVDGVAAPSLSTRALPKGLRLDRLGAPSAAGDAAAPQLASLGLHTDEAFAALNTAVLHDGALVHVAPNARIAPPIALVFVRTTSAAHTLVQPRTLVVLGAHSQAVVLERHVGTTQSAAFDNAVSEYVVDPGAQGRFVLEQGHGQQALHTSTVGLRVGAQAQVELTTFDAGARLCRRSIRADLLGAGARVGLHHAALCNDGEHVALRATVRHVAGHTRSEQVFRAVAEKNGSASFGGCVHILPQAPGAHAEQLSRGLLLHPRGKVGLRPQLMIFTDDVQCRHGATVGALDENALFYLQSRGLSAAQARRLLTLAFLRDSLAHVPPSLAAALDARVTAWLGASDVPAADAALVSGSLS